MGSACSCLDSHQHDHHHVVRYGDGPSKYTSDRLQLQGMDAAAANSRSQHHHQHGLQHAPGSPRKGPINTAGNNGDQSDLLQIDEQGSQHQQQTAWHSPKDRPHPLHQNGSGCGGDAAAQQQQLQQQLQQQQQELEEQQQQEPLVPFNWTKGELIGIGAFGRVYTAHNNETGEIFAVKQVSFAKDEALQGRVAEHIRALEAEVDVLKTLSHDNIVRYLGTERTDDALHIFLEYVAEGSIASRLTKFGPFSENVIRNFTAQLLRGLEYLHARGIMHRDIKGANILIDKHGTVKLADFGASKKIEDLATVGSGAGCKSIRGTPYWMAPEVIKQTGHGRPADIWSLACTVIEMATGKPPWSTYTAPVAAMFQIASSKDPPQLPEHLSPEAKDFLLLCFERVARDRANATRLLKHPFVTKVQLPAPLPFPGSSPGNANSNGSPAGQRTAAGGGQGRSPHHHHTSAAAGSTSQQQQRQQPHTPPSARHSTAVQPVFVGGSGNGGSSNSLRPSAAALAASNKARCSPPGNAHGSPRRQQPQQQPGCFADMPSAAAAASPGGNGGGGGPLSRQQGGDASAVVTTMRQQTPNKQQQQQPQEDGPLKQQQHLQQQQQGRSSPRPYEQQQQQHHHLQQQQSAGVQQQQLQQQPQHQQQSQPQQQQQQGRRSITPRSAAAAAAAAEASAGGASAGHDGGGGQGPDPASCMTLVDWNPMVEPSWLPGSYTPQGPAAAAAAAASRRDSRTGGEQQQQYGPGRGSNSGGRDRRSHQQQPSPATAADIGASPHLKRGGGGAGSGNNINSNGSILSAAPGASTRSNGGIGSRKMEQQQPMGGACNGPLASGPVGRASRENGFGLGPGGIAAAAAASGGGGAGMPGPAAAAAMATPNGNAAGRLGSSRAWGTGLTAAGAAGAAGAGLASGASGSSSAATSAVSGSACDAEVCCEDSSGAAGEAHRLSSSGSYGRGSFQQQQQQQGGAAAGAGGDVPSNLSSKHAQWEQELFEELARQREEQRASRAASRRSALHQQ